LDQVKLVDREVVCFLVACELDGVQLNQCSPYMRDWINRERRVRDIRLASLGDAMNAEALRPTWQISKAYWQTCPKLSKPARMAQLMIQGELSH